MNVRDIMAVVLRRWYVVLGVLIGFVALVGVLAADAGVYSTRTVVGFTYPYETTLTPDNSTSNDSVIAFAGLIASEASSEGERAKYSSSDAPFYGAGIREGVHVGLRDVGSQWAPSYGSAFVDVMIVGPTEDWVSERQRQILDRITQSAEANQQRFSTPAEDRIVPRVEPLSLAVEHITPSRSGQVLAVGALAVAAAIVSIGAAIMIDRTRSRAQERRSSKGGAR